MNKSRYFSLFWVIVTGVLCIIFAVLFYPIAADRWGMATGILVTLFCILFIWLIYFIRAHLFTGKDFEK